MARKRICWLIFMFSIIWTSSNVSAKSLCWEVGKKNNADKVWKMLVINPDRVNEKCSFGRAVLHEAVRNSHDFDNSLILSYLLLSGADKEAKNDKGYTPLMLAVDRGEVWAVKLLLTAGADVNAEIDKSEFFSPGLTPIWFAVKNSSSELVYILLKLGASTDVKDKRGRSLLEMAKSKKSSAGRKIFKMLMKASN